MVTPSLSPGVPVKATIGMASANRIGTGMKPHLSRGRMMMSPPTVPAIWNAVVASCACSTGTPLLDRIVGIH